MVVAEDGDSNPADLIVDAVAGTYDDVAVGHALDSAAVGMNDALARGIEVVSVVSDFVILVDENLDPESDDPEMDTVDWFVAKVAYVEAFVGTADLHCADLGMDCGPGKVS